MYYQLQETLKRKSGLHIDIYGLTCGSLTSVDSWGDSKGLQGATKTIVQLPHFKMHNQWLSISPNV